MSVAPFVAVTATNVAPTGATSNPLTGTGFKRFGDFFVAVKKVGATSNPLIRKEIIHLWQLWQ